MTHTLIIEDDTSFSEILRGFLKKHGHDVKVAHKIKEGYNLIQEHKFDLILLDFRLPDGTGMDILTAVHKRETTIPTIVMTGFYDIRTAVQSIKSGADDYITKPINPDELLLVIQEVLNKHQKEKTKPAEVKQQAAQFIQGHSEEAKQIYDHVALVAPTDISLIIQGESGTGKEQIAQAVHRLSKRADKAFVAVDCGALSPELAGSELFGHIKGAFTGALQNKKGQFEAADGGTLFLDEVGNLNYEVQVKLLRAIQEREIQPIGSNQILKVDVRIITATNDDLINSVRTGKFREDLYHRLNEFKIKLYPLRERKEDLDEFFNYFITQANNELGKNITGLADDVRNMFMKYEWPGNLRELKNMIRRAVLLAEGNEITMNEIPAEMSLSVEENSFSPGPDLKLVQAIHEKELIIKTLKEVKYNKAKAARLLNIDRKTLYYKIAKYHIKDV